MKKPGLVALTGAGISAESGLGTFRGSGGLWEGHRIEDVATPEAWERNPSLVLRFYNERRVAARKAEPNNGHRALAALEQWFDVTVITQNVDDLHERGGSSRVIHLHGSLFEARSTSGKQLIYPITDDYLELGDCCEDGAQLRPNIVWFGEAVPMMEHADQLAREADIFVVAGTSLAVYPAAGLLWNVRSAVPIYLVDPARPSAAGLPDLTYIQEPASTGMPRLRDILLERYGLHRSVG